MENIANKENVFVNYPLGAGGMFLSAIVNFFYNPLENVRFDHLGSGHANTWIKHVNDYYPNKLLDAFGKAIIHDTDYNTWPEKERLDFLKTATSPIAKNKHVISLHCANLMPFFQSFSQSKFIIIDIDKEQIPQCRYNVLVKNIQQHPEMLRGLTAQYGRNFDEDLEKLKNLTKENFDYFNWLDVEITSFSNQHYFDEPDRILQVSYTEYLNSSEEDFLDKILTFLNLCPEKHVYDSAVDALMIYRSTQPKIPS